MKRFVFWINRIIFKKRYCNQFCPTCEYYKICSEEIIYEDISCEA